VVVDQARPGPDSKLIFAFEIYLLSMTITISKEDTFLMKRLLL